MNLKSVECQELESAHATIGKSEGSCIIIYKQDGKAAVTCLCDAHLSFVHSEQNSANLLTFYNNEEEFRNYTPR